VADEDARPQRDVRVREAREDRGRRVPEVVGPRLQEVREGRGLGDLRDIASMACRVEGVLGVALSVASSIASMACWGRD